MRKNKYLIYVILFSIYITTQFLFQLHRVVIFVNHFSLFLVLALISYDVVTAIAIKLITKYQLKGGLETLVYTVRVTTFTILITSISIIQINYIKFQYIPVTRECKYYDQYNNLIYQSEFAWSACPNLNIISNDSNTLVFDVLESVKVTDIDRYSIDEDNYINNPVINIEKLTSISIEYGGNNKINSVNYQVSTLNHVTTDGHDQYQEYRSFHKIIKNVNEASTFDQKVLIASQTFNLIPVEEKTILTHHQFDQSDYLETHYYTEQDNKVTGNLSYSLLKEYTEDGEAKTEEIATIIYSKLEEDVDHYSVRINSKVDDVVEKTINVDKRRDDITYSIIERYISNNNHQQLDINYKDHSGTHLISLYQENIYKDGINTGQYTNKYSFVPNVDGNDYLVSSYKSNKDNDLYANVFTKLHKDKTLYLIDSTVYGKKVTYKELTGQSYFKSLIFGVTEKPEWLALRKAESNTLFDLEYQLQSHPIFYNDLPGYLNLPT